MEKGEKEPCGFQADDVDGVAVADRKPLMSNVADFQNVEQRPSNIDPFDSEEASKGNIYVNNMRLVLEHTRELKEGQYDPFSPKCNHIIQAVNLTSAQAQRRSQQGDTDINLALLSHSLAAASTIYEAQVKVWEDDLQKLAKTIKKPYDSEESSAQAHGQNDEDLLEGTEEMDDDLINFHKEILSQSMN